MTDQAAKRMFIEHGKSLDNFLDLEFPKEELSYTFGWSQGEDWVCTQIHLKGRDAYYTTFHNQEGEVENEEAIG